MKKLKAHLMLKKLTYLLFFSLFSFVHAELYTIKLAVYKDLSTLKQEIKKLSPQLQKHINIVHIGELYKASMHPKNNKKALQPFLPLYRKVFPDAFISSVKQSSIKKDKKIIPTSTGTLLDAKIKNHTLYLCSEGKNKDKVLIAVSFKENTVNYKPLIGKIPPISAHYTIKNNKLFLYQKGLLNSQVYSLLEKTYPNYYLISSWAGNKKLNTLRYYLTLKNAKAYLKSL
jgi:hypothetical protein